MQATILVSKITAERLGSEFRLGRTAVLPVKGKQQPVEVVEVLGLETREPVWKRQQTAREVH